LLEGSSSLRELNRKLGLHLPLGNAKTLNGLILEHLEDIPEAGTSLKIAGYPIEIIQVQDRTVKIARIFPGSQEINHRKQTFTTGAKLGIMPRSIG